MNVYILSVASRLARQGVSVDVYTRCHGQNLPTVQELDPGFRLIQIQAGPCAPVVKENLPELLPAFLDGVLTHAATGNGHASGNGDGSGNGNGTKLPVYDVVHGHYWLSGWVGRMAGKAWGAPLVTSFHTLGKVKNSSAPPGEPPEPEVRLRGEERIVRASDRILSPSPAEANDLIDLYAADPSRIRVVAPGVDRTLFAPRPKEQSKARLGLSGRRVLLFVGRVQPLKGPDVAIRAMAAARRRRPQLTQDVVLAIVGGPTGAIPQDDEVARLQALARSSGLEGSVIFFPPQPHETLADFYSAAEAVLLPSRTESFGLVALEAQSCGTPVIGAAVGGLRHAISNGSGGMLIEGHDPEAYGDAVLALLGDPGLASSMSQAAVRHASGFSWEATAAGLGHVYQELADSTAR
jgi:D-inositol-3-phosphate glycosyltransferase